MKKCLFCAHMMKPVAAKRAIAEFIGLDMQSAFGTLLCKAANPKLHFYRCPSCHWIAVFDRAWARGEHGSLSVVWEFESLPNNGGIYQILLQGDQNEKSVHDNQGE